MKPAQKRILVFNVNWLGDVLFSSAAIRNIRYNFPRSFIACVVPSRCSSLTTSPPAKSNQKSWQISCAVSPMAALRQGWR